MLHYGQFSQIRSHMVLYNVHVLFSNVNDEILVADIDEKENAEKKFKQAVRGGQTAATVEAR